MNLVDYNEKKLFNERIKVCYMINKDYTTYYIDLKDPEKQKTYTMQDLKRDACSKW